MARILLLLFLLTGCASPQMLLNYPVATKPLHVLEPAPQKIILLNGFDVRSQNFRDNKAVLYIEMIDSLMQLAASRIQAAAGMPVKVIKGYTPNVVQGDSVPLLIMQQHQASHAIVISSFAISFIQTRVDVTKESSGSKTREAFYDIESVIGYHMFNLSLLLNKEYVTKRKFHSSRSVVSGLLAAGPGVVAQQKDGYEIMVENSNEYLNRFIPGEVIKYRSVFTGKEFETSKVYIKKGDFEAALIENLKLTNSTNKSIAAQASYNCAVLYERKNQRKEAERFLQKSRSLIPLREAEEMIRDYQ